VTVTPASNIPISINYTSKDYYAIREELIARIQDRIPEWTASDPADFGVALVEAFAYVGDLMSYYIDRSANEAFIDTATQRNSVLAIAQSYGYNPANYRAAFTTLTFTNTSASDVDIPVGTVISGDVTLGDVVTAIYFTTDAAVTVPATDAITGVASEGRSVQRISDNANTIGELIGTSTGSPKMAFELGESPVVDGSIAIYVQDGAVFSKWTRVEHVVDYGPTDQVFTTATDQDNVVLINFGDGVSGVIPVLYSEIRAEYTVGSGSLGNVNIDTLINFDYIPGLSEGQTAALQSAVTVTNLVVAIGGSDPEETNQIRSAAPLTLRANNRAVTLQDYADLSLGVGGVGKASATAATWTSVTVYIAPTRTATDTDASPGLDINDATTTEWNRLQEDVELFLSDKVLLGTSVTVSPPTYVDVNITITYTKQVQYTADEVEDAIKIKLLRSFGYTGVNFEDTIYPEDIEFELSQVPGVKVVRISSLYRTGSGVALTTLIGLPNEIFSFSEDQISIGVI